MEEVARLACDSNGGTIRATIGDAHFMTFPDANSAIHGILSIMKYWDAYLSESSYPTTMALGAHIADVFIFRSCIYGDQINKAALIESMCRSVHPERDRSVALISNQLHQASLETPYECNIQKYDPFVVDKHMTKRYASTFAKGESVFELIPAISHGS